MNLRILFMLLIYYTIISLFYIFAIADSSYYNPTVWTNSVSLNSSNLSSGEVDSGGFFTTGISILRFLMFVGVGFGIDAPTWFQIIFSAWTIILNILAVGFVISSVWNG